MKLNWKAILTGFVVTIALALTSGLIYVGSDATVAVLYWGTIGLLGGLTAGYLAGNELGSGAVHGAIATVFGSLILLAIAIFTTLLFAGVVASVSMFVFGSLVLAFYAIPGALGGAIGSWMRERRSAPGRASTQI